jgi:hypothetical protein
MEQLVIWHQVCNCLQLDSNSYYLITCDASLTMSLFAYFAVNWHNRVCFNR